MIEYVTYIQSEPEQVLRLINVQVTSEPTVLGLICPRWPLAVPVDFATPLAAVDYGSLISRLQEYGEVPMAELHQWAATRPDVVVTTGLREVTREVKAGDWTYLYNVLQRHELDE